MIWRNLGLITLFLIGCLLLTMLWLRYYTHHGQSLVLPDYKDQALAVAIKDADQKSFEIHVVDSVHIVGKDGGIIINQNPPADSKVKQRRKIYVTVTKHEAVQIPVRRLPILYGKSYDRKRKELKQGFEINTKVIGRKYDAGAPDHILEVSYAGETIINANRRKDNVQIPKGATLDMVLSKSTGGSLSMPDLACKLYDEAVFQCQALQLVVADPEMEDSVDRAGDGYVWKQEPAASSRIYTGDTVILFLASEPPSNCE